MRLFFILFLLLKIDVSVAQNHSILQGKWKVISMAEIASNSRDSLYYDLERDSIYVPAEDLKEAYKDGHDSTFTVNLFKSMYGSLKGSSFTFKKDSVLLETKSIKTKGTYQIKRDDTLEMLLINERKELERNIYIFSISGNILNILVKTDIGYTRFILQKE